MNIKLTAQLFESGMNITVNRSILLLIFLFWFSVASASQADVTERVSLDIALFNAFEAQSKSLATNKQGGFVTIGADGACDFDSAVNSIQVPIDAGATEIRVASNGTYQNNLTIENQSVVIRGGFADCVAADANQQLFNDLTVIDGSASAEPVIYITGSEAIQQIRLENLILTGGTSVFPKFGGGLSVDLAAVNLQLLRVSVTENSGSAGAGIQIDAGQGANSVDTQIMGREVVIQNNDSSSIGGGLACVGSADITFTGMSLISNNMANLGGGVSLRHGCTVSMYSEFFEDSLSFLTGLFNNQSLSNGGGAYLFNGSELYLFGQQMCNDSGCLGSGQISALVRGNEAGLSLAHEGNGGGFYMAQSGNQNLFYANGLIMFENSARQNGGAGYLDLNGRVIIERQTGGCWDQDRCNIIMANSSGVDTGLGGAFYVADGGELNLSQSYLQRNRADIGTAIFASGETVEIFIEGSVFNNNGDEGSDGFSDFGVISVFNGASVDIRHATIVDNNLTSSVFGVGLTVNSSLTLFNSIVHDPGSGNLFGPDNGPLNINCLLTHEDSSFSGTQVLVDDPQFFNRLGEDFHLNPSSPAIDMCQSIPMLRPLDIDAELRGWDDPDNNNGLGVFDAGADESYINDVIFENNFESI